MPRECSVRIPSSSFLDSDVIGQMIWAATLLPENVAYDCAVVRLDNVPLPEVMGVLVNNVWIDDILPTNLKLMTTTLPLEGVLVSQASTEQDLGLPMRDDGPFHYQNLFEVTYDRETMGGMSGGPVLSPEGQLVGMHVAGLQNRGFFHRADQVLKAMQMVMYRT